MRICYQIVASCLLAACAFIGTQQAIAAEGELSTSPLLYQVGKNPQDIATADLNDDGLMDIAISTDKSIEILINKGYASGPSSFSEPIKINAWTYQASCGQRPIHARDLIAADLDSDGRTDLAYSFTNYATLVTVLHNKSANSDLKLDPSGYSAEFRTNIGNPIGRICTETGDSYLAAGDLNFDGRLDLALAAVSQNKVYLMQNLSANDAMDITCVKPPPVPPGSNCYQMGSSPDFDEPAVSPRGVAIANFTGDTGPDLVVPGLRVFSRTPQLFIYKNNSYTNTPSVPWPWPIATISEYQSLPDDESSPSTFNQAQPADVNDCTESELLLLEPASGKLKVFCNHMLDSQQRPMAATELSLGGSPTSFDVDDVDDDNLQDIVWTDAGQKTVSLLRNVSYHGINNFTMPASSYSAPSSPADVSVIDADNDGDGDVVTSLPASGQLAFYENLTHTQRNWCDAQDLDPECTPEPGNPTFKASFSKRGNLKLQLDAGEDAPGLAKAKVTLPFKLKGMQKGYQVESSKKKKTVITLTSAKAEGERSLKLTLKKKRMRIKKCGSFSFKATVEDAGKTSTNFKAKAKRPNKLCSKKSRRRK